jgi:hypothetical protein
MGVEKEKVVRKEKVPEKEKVVKKEKVVEKHTRKDDANSLNFRQKSILY